MGNLTNLEKLSVASNNIAALPDTVGRLGRLRQLEVGTNKLRHLPESLATCAELEIINSVDNYLEDIPEGFGQLRKLRTLALDNNRISRVPTAVLKGCIALQTLQLHSNPITPQVRQYALSVVRVVGFFLDHMAQPMQSEYLQDPQYQWKSAQ